MKNLFYLLAVGFCLSLPVVAQDIDKLPVVTVVGTADVQVEPDEATFSLGVTKTDKVLQTAKRQNDESIAKILELTRRFSIAPQNVKTDFISVEMKYEVRDPKTRMPIDPDEPGKKVFVGYAVSKTVIVKLTDLSRFEEFFSDVLKTGLSEVNRVEFATSKLRENKDKAREMAIKAAREKAGALTTAVGQSIGKAVSITEEGSMNPYYNPNSNVQNSTSFSGSYTQSVATFALGTIKVQAQVRVSFLLN